VRATEHGSFHSARFIMTSQDARNAGQASRSSSRSQPGRLLKATGRSTGPGAGVATGAGAVSVVFGGGVVLQPARIIAVAASDASKLRRLFDIKDE
jgi:hypothetical protein